MNQAVLLRKQFLKYLLVGAFATTVNYGIFYLLLEYFHLHYLISSATGFICSVFAGYFFNRTWTFEAQTKSKAAILKYYTVYIFSLLLSMLILKLSVDIFHIDARTGNIIAIGITMLTNFAGTKFWAFEA